MKKEKLNQSNEAEAYAKQLDAMLSDVVSVPHFNDKDIELEKWAIHFFHKETKEQIEWTIIVCTVRHAIMLVPPVLYRQRSSGSAVLRSTTSTLTNVCRISTKLMAVEFAWAFVPGAVRVWLRS